ncbi:hypothetical protein [Pedobacter sp. JCM 36344]|uniref:hypothetical protein n=1 Tax=Pedobacter sp. JCM 36344 TaxID=3374280 RepID=UPI00397ACE34
MGSIIQSWHNDLLTELNSVGLHYEIFVQAHYSLVLLKEGEVVLNLLNLNNSKTPEEVLNLPNVYNLEKKQLIHLWEDVWSTRKEQVLSRLKAIAGLNTRIHARKTEIVSLSQPEANVFLNKNHLQFSVGARHRYGLVVDNGLVAVACFSGLRKMHNGTAGYRSAELIRFANLHGITVIGGFTKLLSHFIKRHQPNDIMSYADRDWSKGSAYERSGFILAGITPPAIILVNKNTLSRTFAHRMNDSQSEDLYLKIFNTGNLKYILACE